MYSRKYLSIFLYITIIIFIFIFKPKNMFDKDGNIKHFDYDNDIGSSLLSIEIVLPILAILCYFITIILELII